MNTSARVIALLCALFAIAQISRASPFPDPLEMLDGTCITTADAWREKRAPELLELFQHYEYGIRPKDIAATAKLIREDKNALGGKATLRELIIDIKPAAEPVRLLVVVPNKRTRPAPCFLGMAFSPIYTLLNDPLIQLPNGGSEDKRGANAATWPIELIIDRGYAIACFFKTDIMTDSLVPARETLKRFAAAAGVQPDDPTAPGTIMAWAWSYSRILDYLQTVPEIDAHHIAAVGHSRNGKASLVAAAYDKRFAMVIPSQAGCAGTAPSRVSSEDARLSESGRPRVETVARITTTFPYWFCKNFAGFAIAPEKLPFDQHALIALCAPRPVLVSCATEDIWANPAGQFEMLRAADPVYRLVAKQGLRDGVTQMPPAGTLIDSRLGFFIREGKHAMTTKDWTAWLDYADKWLK